MGTNLIIRDADFSKNAIFKPEDLGVVAYSLFNRHFTGIASDRINTEYDLYGENKVWTLYANITFDYTPEYLLGVAVNAWGQSADSKVVGFQVYLDSSEGINGKIVPSISSINNSAVVYNQLDLGEYTETNRNVKVAFRRNNNDTYILNAEIQSTWQKSSGSLAGISSRRKFAIGSRDDGDTPFKGTINSCILYLENIESVDSIKKLAKYY